MGRPKALVALDSQLTSLKTAITELEYVQTRQMFLADGNRVADLYLNDLLQTQARLEAAEQEVLRAEVGVASTHFRRIFATGSMSHATVEAVPASSN